MKRRGVMETVSTPGRGAAASASAAPSLPWKLPRKKHLAVRYASSSSSGRAAAALASAPADCGGGTAGRLVRNG